MEEKIIKVPDGKAYIAISKDCIRIGVGGNSFITITENGIDIGGPGMNFQFSPDKQSYMGVLNHIHPIAGLFPIGPKYGFNVEIASKLIEAGVIASRNMQSLGFM